MKQLILLTAILLTLTGCPGTTTTSQSIATGQYNACVDFGAAEPIVSSAIRAKLIKPPFDKLNKAIAVGKYWCGTVPQPQITDPAVLANLVTNVALIVATKTNLGK